MGQRKWWKLSAKRRSNLWKRWKAGESLHAMGRALGREHHVINFLLARHGESVRQCVAAAYVR
jgi:hypothetical protein